MPISDVKFRQIMTQAGNEHSEGYDYEQAIRDACEEHEADLGELQQAREEAADQTREPDIERARLQAIKKEADRSAGEAMPGPSMALSGAAYEQEWQRAEDIAGAEHDRRMEELCEQQGTTVIEVVEEGDRVLEQRMQEMEAADREREAQAREQGIELSPF